MKIRARILTAFPLIALALWAVAAGTLLASPASAHAALVSADPALNAKLDRMPGSINLEFSDEMNQPSQISVLGPDGKKIGRGETVVDGNVVSRQVADPGQAGIYRVDYRVVSADGHPVTSSYKFTVTTGTPASSKTTSEPLRSEKQFRWFFILFGALALVIVVLYVVARIRPTTDE